jgi:hypothetical protein
MWSVKMKFSNYIVAFAFLLFAVAGQAEPTAGFSESRIKATVGEMISVDIILNGFPLTEGGGLTLNFNPDVVTVIDVDLNESTWSFGTRDGTIDNDKGRVSDMLFSSYRGISGDATVATVTLVTIASGRSKLKLVESSLNPFAAAGEPLTVALNKAEIRVRKEKSR